MTPHTNKKWRFWIDRGGTFTDIVATNPKGQILTKKLLSENPESYEDAALEGIRQFLGDAENTLLSGHKIHSVKMGTTVATNALLERKGEPTALAITAGLRDALEIGYQTRPDIFALNIDKPEPLYTSVTEIEERLDAQGQVLTPLHTAKARANLQTVYEAGFRSIAIVCMHSYLSPVHENALAKIAKNIGFTQISTSSDVSPLVKFIASGDVTVVDAYLSPILKRYIDRVAKALGKEEDGGPKLLFMQSSGGLASADFFHGRNAVLSGPAGGVIGAVRTAEQAGFKKIIGFDMGGTSTDVCHYIGNFERNNDAQITGVRIRAPMLEIHTVAAGGGSILGYDGLRFKAGPQSAGAHPGPACYGRGGPLCVSDINAVLGKLSPEIFPKIFGPDQNAGLDIQAARAQFAHIAKATGKTIEETAEGFLTIAVGHMARAIKKISIERGYDLEGYTLTSFGGAGGQHACLVANELGIDSILIHPMAGLLSALGMGLADISSIHQKSVNLPISELDKARKIAEELTVLGHKTLAAQNIEKPETTAKTIAHIRYAGSDTTLAIPLSNTLKADFETAHYSRFSFIYQDTDIIIDSMIVEVSGGGEALGALELNSETKIHPQTLDFYTQRAWHNAEIYHRNALIPNQIIKGPAIILDAGGTNIIEPGWQAKLTPELNLHLTRTGKTLRRETHTKRDPIKLEIFNNQFMAIAEQMGVVLRNTATSVNIKERLDFSCAIFDARGGLVANAPHMPVHIGSMDASIRALMTSGLTMRVGDSFVHNNPYDGGTHLPDINVITPAFDAAGKAIIFYVASRGHHADVGGIAPGSMSPLAKNIFEEGVVIDCMKLVENSVFLEENIHAVLTSGDYPARNPAQNIADLKAQIAANAKGVSELKKLCNAYGFETVHNYMGFCQDNGEENVRAAISKLSDCKFTYKMDQGCKICVTIKVNQETQSAHIDFAGTSPQRGDNFNAPIAVTYAAVLYVFRCLVGSDIPLNAGCLRPLNIHVPKGCMLRPKHPAAIVAGNVEVSQAITNALFGALGILGSSQGTMNNLTFGNDKYQYYETICSGAPAGPGFHGAHAIHTHMTNSVLTDPEILELRYPVRVDKFEITHGSGGKGQYNSGDGVRRALTFLEDMECSILSGNRIVPCFGSRGGEAGQLGKNTIRRADGSVETLKGCDSTKVSAGDTIIVETPTGGGYGCANTRKNGFEQ